MSEIKLVVCDLDGTLLNDEKMITPYTVSVMKKVREMGIAVCLASGRDEQMMSIYEKQLGGCEYMLSDNGALVRSGKRVICCNFLAEEDTASLLAYLNEQQMTFMMYSAEQMYFSEGSEKLKKRIRDYEALSQKAGCPVKLKVREFLRSGSVLGYKTAAKIVAYEENETAMEAYISFVDSLANVHHEPTGYGLLGAFRSQVSKKTALETIMQEKKIGKENVCVFGDYENDLSMFACADYRICMENGVKALKDAASSVTFSNNDDGVARYLEKELGIVTKQRLYEL